MTVCNKKTTKFGKKDTRNGRFKNDPSNMEGYLCLWGKSIKTAQEKELHEKELSERKEEWDRKHPNREEKTASKRHRLDREYLECKYDADDPHEAREAARAGGGNNSNNNNKSSTAQMVDTQNKNAEKEADLEELRRKRECWSSKQIKIESNENNINKQFRYAFDIAEIYSIGDAPDTEFSQAAATIDFVFNDFLDEEGAFNNHINSALVKVMILIIFIVM